MKQIKEPKVLLPISLIIGIVLIILALVFDLITGKKFQLGPLQLGMLLLGILLSSVSALLFLKHDYLNALLTIVRTPGFGSKLKLLAAFWRQHSWLNILVLAVVSIIFIWPIPIETASRDAAYYLSLAKNLYLRHGYVNPDLTPALYRGPAFPMMLSFTYDILGYGFQSALIMMRLFWLGTIVVIFLLGKELFNAKVGMISAVLVMTAQIISLLYGYVWTDGVVTFLVLLVQLLFWVGLRKNYGILWYFLLGLLIGIAFYVKQTAVTMVPTLFLIWLLIPKYRNRRNFLSLVMFGLVFVLFITGWMVFVHLNGGSDEQVFRDFRMGSAVLSFVTNAFNPSNIRSYVTAGTAEYSRQTSILQVFTALFTEEIAPFFRYAVLFIPALFFSLYQAVFKKDQAHIYLLAGLVPFFAVVPTSVANHFGQRAFIYLYIVLILMTVAMIVVMISRLRSVPQTPIYLLAILLLIGVQIPDNLSRFSSFSFTKPAAVKFFQYYREPAEWIDAHIKPDENILASEGEIIKFHVLVKGDRIFYPVHVCNGPSSFFAAEKCAPPYISLWMWHGASDPNQSKDEFRGISEQGFLKIIKDKQIAYFILTNESYYLFNYVKDHPDFEKVAVFDKAIIYRVHQPVRSWMKLNGSDFPLCLGDGTSIYMEKLIQNRPDLFENRVNQLYRPWMGLNQDDIRHLVGWQGCQIASSFLGDYRTLK